MIETDVLIVGSGSAGSAAALALSTYGVPNVLVSKCRWLANTPRAHITDQRTFEVLRDLGVDAEAKALAVPQDWMGNTVFCASLAGEELGRIHTWGTHPARRADYQFASRCEMDDLPQTLMELILLGAAADCATTGRCTPGGSVATAAWNASCGGSGPTPKPEHPLGRFWSRTWRPRWRRGLQSGRALSKTMAAIWLPRIPAEMPGTGAHAPIAWIGGRVQSPVDDLALLIGDGVTAVLVALERQSGRPGIRKGINLRHQSASRGHRTDPYPARPLGQRA